MSEWKADVLGDGYEQRSIPLGQDPDGEGTVDATLVRREQTGPAHAAVLYVHGFTDYFFQRELADFFAERGFAFYGLDLRKCGRSLRPGHTAHYVSDLALYDTELDEAVRLVRAERGDVPVVLVAHSTGGLILPLWLDRLNRREGGSAGAGIAGLVLNSPWFDLQGKAYLRSVGTQAIKAISRAKPKSVIKLPPSDAYGTSLHVSGKGEWEFDTAWKPMAGFPVTFGWMTAVRRGHAALHRGLDIGVPSLVLRSTRTHFATAYRPEIDNADGVLDVRQIARWSGCLGGHTTVAPIEGGRHDIFLSLPGPRAQAYDTVDTWLTARSLTAAPTV